MMKTKRDKNGFAALKLDMSKAYDRVEWSYVSQVMHKLGFNKKKWIDLIMNYITSVTFSILLNGEAKGHIIPSRRLRQGDPLSLYLFLLCSEGFSALINLALQPQSLQGLAVARFAPKILHIFFANDSLIFLKATTFEFGISKGLLQDYETTSDQCVNFQKSVLYFSPLVPSDTQEYLNNILHMKVVENLGKYLGLPTMFSCSKINDYQYIVDRVWKKLQGWKEKFFSGGGKEILIKSVVQAIPTYAMRCFRLPKSLVLKISSLCAKFWWGSSEECWRIHWMRWEKLCQPKELGGLNFCDIEGFNQAMLAKTSMGNF